MKTTRRKKKVTKQPQYRWILLGFCFFVLTLASINILDRARLHDARTLSLADRIRNRTPAESVEGVLQRFIEQEGEGETQVLAGSLFGLTPATVAGAQTEDAGPGETAPPALRRCSDPKLGFRVLCDPQWSYQEYPNAILLIISSEPAVTVTVAKIKTDIRFIGQLNRDKLLALGQYADGFQVEDARLADQRAVRVKGFSSRYPSIRLMDYYLLHDQQLYSVMFSCNPKESWDDYKFLMQKIVESFVFEAPETQKKDLSQAAATPEAGP